MKKVLIAASTVLAAAAAANADVVVSLPGGNFPGGAGVTVTSTPLIGTLTGVIVEMTYANAVGGSWAADVGFTVDSQQWGGYDILINGATSYQGLNSFPDSGANGSFASGFLASNLGVVYNNTTAVVGFGNGYSWPSSGFDASDVKITLVGVDKIPAPGAMALLGLAGIVGRRRRA